MCHSSNHAPNVNQIHISKGIHDHYHVIHLIPGSVPPNIRPYINHYVQMSEIKRMIAEMLEARIIQPSCGSK